MKTVEQAMKKLKRLKVNELYNDDALHEFESEFDGVWWRVLHEYDMYEEGQIDEEFKHEHLNKQTAKTTYKWLEETQHLTINFKDMRF